MTIERKRKAVRDLITASGFKYAYVTFLKKDGTKRTMKLAPATIMANVKGDEASPSRKAASAKWQANNPHLMPVWDVDRAAIRSVNLDTTERVAALGKVLTFAPDGDPVWRIGSA